MFLGAWPVDTHHGEYKLIVIIGFFLLMLLYGLLRGKRTAWCAAVILLLLSVFLHILCGGQVLVTVITGVVLTLLVVFSRFFRARSDPPSIWRGYIALLSGLGVVTLYTIGGFIFLYDQLEPFNDRYGIEDVLLRLLTNSHLSLPHGTEAFLFGRALPVLCLSAVLYGIVMILRPVAAVLFPNEQDRRVASSLTHIYGRNSISYFALSADKSYFFSASSKSVISYVLEGNVAVVAGDPIGPEEEMLPVLQQFMAFCHQQDWTMVFWQVHDTLADLYRTAGLHLVKIGEDAIVTTRTFTLAGKAMANVRTSAKRAEKEGIHIVFSRGRIQNTEHLTQMEQISRDWLTSKGSEEMGFSMGHFDVHGDEEQIYALAVDNGNQVLAFATFVPIYGRNGWGLDLMRRAHWAAPGTMELLLARSIESLKREGADSVSLGLAPQSKVNDTDQTFLGTSIDFLTHRFGNPGKKHSLFTFKKKFQPCWENRYLVYSNTLTLPKIGWALYHAHQRDTSLLTACYRFLKDWQAKHQGTRRNITDLAKATGPSSSGGLSL
jgi:phosphatidylglycerol lysyltransferase